MSSNPRLVTEEEFDNISDYEIDALKRYLNLLAIARSSRGGTVTVTVRGEEIAHESVSFTEDGKLDEVSYDHRPRPEKDLSGVPTCLNVVRAHGGNGLVSILLKAGKVYEVKTEVFPKYKPVQRQTRRVSFAQVGA